MKKRFIAAVVLASVGLWSVPVALASPRQSRSLTVQKPEQQASAGMHDHSRCPGVNSRLVPPLIVTPAPASIPCSDEHPCCAKQRPENPPSLPAAAASARPGSEAVPAAIADQHHDGRAHMAAAVSGTNSFPSCSARSTVLRI